MNAVSLLEKESRYEWMKFPNKNDCQMRKNEVSEIYNIPIHNKTLCHSVDLLCDWTFEDGLLKGNGPEAGR